MVAWNAFVGFLSVVLSLLTTAYGGNLGFALITLSLITRLALLPLSLRMARHAQAQQRILQTIKREIDEFKAKYKSSPQKLGTELSQLYQKHGVKPIEGVNSLGLIVASWRGRVFGDQAWVGSGQPILLDSESRPAGCDSRGRNRSSYCRCFVIGPSPSTTVAVLHWAASTAVSGLQSVLLNRGRT
jgi:OXA1/YqjG-like inner membrane protein